MHRWQSHESLPLTKRLVMAVTRLDGARGGLRCISPQSKRAMAQFEIPASCAHHRRAESPRSEWEARPTAGPAMTAAVVIHAV